MSTPKKTAIVVDDDPEIRTLIAAYLTRLGFEVGVAADGKAAMKKLDEARPTLLCVDLMLPETSGFDVCQYVSKTPALQGLPILMVSARSMPGDIAQAEELGVKEYLIKPFTKAEFEAKVKRVLEGSTDE